MTAVVFADYVCPFCFLEIPALERLRDEHGVELDYRAYELRPDPVPTLDPNGDYLTTTWARSVYPLAERLGVPIQLPPVQPRSRLAFEGLKLAQTLGKSHDYNKAVYEAFFQRGEDIGAVEVLARLAESVGVPAGELRAALSDHRHLPEVLADESAAAQMGLTGVPAVILNRRLLSGCQPYENLRAALTS